MTSDRRHQQGRDRLLSPLLVIIFVLLSTTVSHALAQWKTNQRAHELSWLRDDEMRSLAKLTDVQSIRALLRPILVERQVGTMQHDMVANYLKMKVEEFGFTAEWDSFSARTPMGVKRFHNLVATYDPLVHRRLVLACHYDSKIIPGKVFIGATDSALPCALLLDIAKTLGPLLASRTNQHITLQLIFLDGEEAFHEWSHLDSIYGARHLAEKWERKWYPSTDGSAFELSREIDRIDVFMLLDLLGAKNPRIQSTFGHGATALFEQLPFIEEQLGKMYLLNRIPKIFSYGTTFGAVEDDHLAFMRKGVPVLHLISVPFPHFWHTPGDNESILDNPTIENLATILRVFVARYLGIHPTLR